MKGVGVVLALLGACGGRVSPDGIFGDASNGAADAANGEATGGGAASSSSGGRAEDTGGGHGPGTGGSAEGPTTTEICTNGIDDDGDGLRDCIDGADCSACHGPCAENPNGGGCKECQGRATRACAGLQGSCSEDGSPLFQCGLVAGCCGVGDGCKAECLAKECPAEYEALVACVLETCDEFLACYSTESGD